MHYFHNFLSDYRGSTPGFRWGTYISCPSLEKNPSGAHDYVFIILSEPRDLVFSERELMFMFAICRRRSVCRLSVCRVSSVTFVHPTQAIEIFGNVSTPFGTLAICDPSIKILRRSSQGNPSVEGLNERGVEKCSDFWPFQGYISETVQDRR